MSETAEAQSKANWFGNVRCFRWVAAMFAVSAAAVGAFMMAAVQKPTAPSLGLQNFAAAARNHGTNALAHLPLSFEPNRGQTDSRVKFLARRAGFTVFLDEDGAVLSFNPPPPEVPDLHTNLNPRGILRYVSEHSGRTSRADYVTVGFEGANPHASISGDDRFHGVVNYLLGDNPAQWQRSIPTYGRVRYSAIYPGIDAVFYGNSGRLEYDLDIAPGVDPGVVRLRIGGTRQLSFDRGGNLVLQGQRNNMVLGRPVAYQLIKGTRVPVEAGYVLRSPDEVAVELGHYDHGQALVVDPAISYSTFIGGTEAQVQAVTVTPSGEAVVAGWTCCVDNFPVTGSAEQPHLKGAVNAFVAELNSAGNAIQFATYLGGSDVDVATGVGLDSAGNVYVEGMTNSPDFPTMPVNDTSSAGGFDTFVTSLDPAGDSLLYSRYIGGSGDDLGTALAVDSAGRAYVVGDTYSTDFPATSSGYEDTNPSGGVVSEGFFARIDPPAHPGADGALVYSTYLGGAGQTGATLLQGVANAGPAGQVYVVGAANSGFPTTAGSPFGGTIDAVIANLDTTQGGNASLVFSEFLGGSGLDVATGVATQPGCTSSCYAYVSGYTFSADFPDVLEETSIAGFSDAFAAKVDSHSGISAVDTEGTETFDAAFGIGVDSSGDALVGGITFDSATIQNNAAVTNPLQGVPPPTGQLYVSTDLGTSFGSMNWPSNAGSITLNGLAVDFSPLANATPAPPIVYGGTNTQGLFFSSDGGKAFLQAAVQGNAAAETQVSAVAIQNSGGTAPQTVVAAVNNLIELSGDGGQTWHETGDLPPAGGANVYFVSSDTYLGGFNVFAGTNQGLFVSTDGGIDWSTSTGLAGANQTTQVFTGTRDLVSGNFYVGTDKGVFVSVDNGSTFTATSLNFAPVLSLTSTITLVLPSLSPQPSSTPSMQPTPPPLGSLGSNLTKTTLYAGTYGAGVVSTTDGFVKSMVYGSGLPASTFNYVSADATNPADPAVYVGVGNNLGIGSMWETTDGGVTFSQVDGAGFGPPCCVFPAVYGAGQIYVGNYREADALVYSLTNAFNDVSISNLGGGSFDQVNGVAVDSSGAAYYAGLTYSPDFPLLGPAQNTLGPGGNGIVNGFVTKVVYGGDAQIVVPAFHAFGHHPMRITGKPFTFVVENKSKTSVAHLGYIHLSGQGEAAFQIVSGATAYTANFAPPVAKKGKLAACGRILQPRTKCGITVNFTPLQIGQVGAAVLIPSDAKNGTQATELIGTGFRKAK